MREILLAILVCIAGCSGGTEVHFQSDDITLAGTLLRPDTDEVTPAVVLIHGSGESDRDTMRYFADIFVRNGFAALIYDKRGVGASGGEADSWQRFRFEELANDALAGVRFLAEQEGIDAHRIGLFGASQGGWVAPLAASKSERVAFLVLLSASVSTVAEDRLFERAARLRSEGFSEEEIAEVQAMQLVDQELTRSGDNFDEFRALWNQNVDKRWFRRVYLGEEPAPADSDWRLWYRTVLDYDPLPFLRTLDIPTLFLFGDPAHDRFGPVEQSIAQVEALAASGKPFEYESYAGTDHNLQSVEDGQEAPYPARIANWLASRE